MTYLTSPPGFPFAFISKADITDKPCGCRLGIERSLAMLAQYEMDYTRLVVVPGPDCGETAVFACEVFGGTIVHPAYFAIQAGEFHD